MARILVIDDSSSSRLLLKGMLTRLGHEVVEAPDGVEGLKQLSAQWPIALVLLDWHMDKMDGPAFLNAARADQTAGRVPVVMVTAESNPQLVRDAILLGLSGYILKPFNKEAVQERLAALIVAG
jgi:two-component system chemotaxis response regulator CheY